MVRGLPNTSASEAAEVKQAERIDWQRLLPKEQRVLPGKDMPPVAGGMVWPKVAQSMSSSLQGLELELKQ